MSVGIGRLKSRAPGLRPPAPAARFARATVCALLAVTAGGCAWNAAPPMYYKPGIELDARERDEKECVQVSLVKKPGPAGAVALEEDRSAYHTCMQNRGYTKLKD